MSELFRIKIDGKTPYTEEEGLVFHEYAIKRFPMIKPLSCKKRLAVVGGGVSVSKYLNELKNFDGDIFSINASHQWLCKQGIKSTFVSVDAFSTLDESILKEWLKDVNKAYVASIACHAFIDALDGKDVKLFSTEPKYGDNFISGGSTTACRMAQLGLKLGYTDISFYGCDGSYEDTTHADRNDIETKDMLIVNTNGQDFRTSLQMLNQCEYLSEYIRNFPNVFHCKSDGLLKAMIEDSNWQMVAFSEKLHKNLSNLGIIEKEPTFYKEI